MSVKELKSLKEEIQSDVNYQINQMKKREAEHRQLVQAMEEAGWVKGEHFDYDFTWKDGEIHVTTGNYYDDTAQSHTVSSKVYIGRVYCKVFTVNNTTGELNKKSKGYIRPVKVGRYNWKQRVAYQSSCITDNYRNYSLKTLLERMIWKNERTVNESKYIIELNIKNSSFFDKCVENFKEHQVEKYTKYSRYRSYEYVKVTLENGSHIILDEKSDGSVTIVEHYDSNIRKIKDVNEMINYLK